MTDVQQLTDREFEILELLVTGKSNKEIARDLHISANTVKVHVRNIFAKLNVTTRTEASMVAIQNHLIPGLEHEPAGQQHTDPSDTDGASPAETIRTAGGPGLQVWYAAGLFVTITLLLVIAFRLFNPEVNPVPTSFPESITIENPWTERPNLPRPRTNAAAVALENQIYIIGGLIEGRPSGSLLRLDPETGVWDALADKPTPVSDVQAVVLGGRIYVPGGKAAGGAASTALEIYDPANDRWSAGPALPAAVDGFALAAFEGKIYLFGGQDRGVLSDRVYLFHPDQGSWSELAPMPARLAYAGAAVVGNRIYLVGGHDGASVSNTAYVYYPAREGADPWDTAAELPEGRYAMGVVSIADKIHLIGGLGSTDAHFTQMSFTPQTGLWEVSENPLAGVWAHFAAVALGTEIYGLGGELNGSPTDRSLSYQVLFVVRIPVIQENQ